MDLAEERDRPGDQYRRRPGEGRALRRADHQEPRRRLHGPAQRPRPVGPRHPGLCAPGAARFK